MGSSLLSKGEFSHPRNRIIKFFKINHSAQIDNGVATVRESLAATFLWSAMLILMSFGSFKSWKIPVIDLPLSASASDIRKAWGPGDSGSLLEAALEWSKFKDLDPVTQYWIPQFWSPGLALIEVPLIWLEALGIPIFFSLLMFTILLWSATFFLIWRYLSHHIGRLLIILTSLVLVNSYDFNYIFRDYIFYTEGIGFGLLILGLTILSLHLLNLVSLSTWGKVATGIIIGLSLWVRHTSDSGLIGLFLISSISLANQAFRVKANKKTIQKSLSKKQRNRFSEEQKSRILKSGMFTVFLTSGFALLVTFPWRLIANLHFGGKPLLMSSASGTVPISIWSLPDSPSGKYWGNFGSNWACKVDLERCQALQPIIDSSKSGLELIFLGIQSALLNPIDYFQERFSYFYVAWIPTGLSPITFEALIGILSYMLFPVSVYIAFRNWNSRTRLLMFVWSVFISFNWLQLSLLHYEARYFIPIKLLCMGLLIFLVAAARIETPKQKIFKI